MDNRDHRLLSCPQFAFVQQQLATDVIVAFDGAQDWTLEFLSCSGQCYLLVFNNAFGWLGFSFGLYSTI